MLLNGLQRMSDSDRRRDMPQVLRAEIMDVLQRMAEDEHGLDAVSLVRAARSLSSCGGVREPGAKDDRGLLIESIRVLEQKNRQKDVLIDKLQKLASQQPSPEVRAQAQMETQVQAQKRPSLLLRIMAFLVPAKPKETNTTFMANDFRRNHIDAEGLKTIVLTVHGQSNARSLFDVIADWTSEKLRARRVARNWAAGQFYDSMLVEPDDVSCRFGEWLAHVEPPPHLQRFIDDLRMWHTHWHAMAAQWAQTGNCEAKRDFATQVIKKHSSNQFVYCMQRIDGLLMEMARTTENREAG